MKRLVLLALVLSAGNAHAQVDPKVAEQCKDVRDFVGCVKLMSGEEGISASEDSIKGLVEALRILPARIRNSSRSSLYSNIQIFTDALQSVNPETLNSGYEKEVYDGAVRLDRMISVLAQGWSAWISQEVQTGSSTYTDPLQEIARAIVSDFNRAAGYPAVSYSTYSRKSLWKTYQYPSNPVPDMARVIVNSANELSEDPALKKKRIAEAKRAKELCEMKPWQRHLEENPGLNAWAQANPGPAEIQKKKFLADPKNQSQCESSSVIEKQKMRWQ